MVILLALTLVGCGKNESGSSTGKAPVLSKWKTANTASKAPMGLVLEQAESEIKATLSELNGTNGFVVGAKLAVGSYQPEQKEIILMMGNLAPSLMSVKDWVANGGPYLKIPFEQGATNLAMTTVVRNGPNVTVNLVPFNGE
jgi:hypothetical protein